MTTGWAGQMGIGQALTINTTESDRGYTGQEGLDAVQLDDYNARLYDPALGRFLSVDPLIGHPESTQGINPYSYVENNPLSRTDPTGEVMTEWQSQEVMSMPTGMAINELSAEVGDLQKSGVISNDEAVAGQSVLHQAAPGNSMVSGNLQKSQFIARNVGFDVDKHQVDNTDGDSATTKYRGDSVVPTPADLTPDQRKKLDATIAATNEQLGKIAEHGGFHSPLDAAKFLHAQLDPISRALDVEIGANIYRGSVPNSYTVFEADTSYDSNTVNIRGEAGWTKVADWHTHGSTTNALLQSFSPGDLDEKINQYLSTPSGKLLYYNYDAFKANSMPNRSYGYYYKLQYVEPVPP
ncbi:MAG: RHS repeat-associated core domain-containing protein, partial [Ktedonobacteraceae bacterium]